MSLRVPDHLCWPVWRLYTEKGTDPWQVENYWTLGMVLDANEALDIQEEANRMAQKKAKEASDSGTR